MIRAEKASGTRRRRSHRTSGNARARPARVPSYGFRQSRRQINSLPPAQGRWTWTIAMLISTYNVNGINGRLANLLEWLEQAAPDVVCLQELKAPDEKFPTTALRAIGYGAVWHGQKSWNGVAILARGAEPVETRRGLPGDSDDAHSRYIEAAIRRPDRRMPLSAERQSRAGPEIRLQAALVRPAFELCQDAFGQRRTGRSGRRLQRHADRSRRLRAGALGR